jgi:hypothetical protein
VRASHVWPRRVGGFAQEPVPIEGEGFAGTGTQYRPGGEASPFQKAPPKASPPAPRPLPALQLTHREFTQLPKQPLLDRAPGRRVPREVARLAPQQLLHLSRVGRVPHPRPGVLELPAAEREGRGTLRVRRRCRRRQTLMLLPLLPSPLRPRRRGEPADAARLCGRHPCGAGRCRFCHSGCARTAGGSGRGRGRHTGSKAALMQRLVLYAAQLRERPWDGAQAPSERQECKAARHQIIYAASNYVPHRDVYLTLSSLFLHADDPETGLS